jgi:predicted PurR-regulated permease PerM
LSGASAVVKGTADFVLSLILIIITMYFFFVDGEKMLARIIALTPLPDRHNQEIVHKFRQVSRTTFISTFVAALAQGLVGAIGFGIVGFPAFLAGILVTIFSLLPLGSMVFYVPMGLYYLLAGNIWPGVFILLWGVFIISTVDNIVRAYMIKDGAEINPIFVLFSILGGVLLFGFWGVILGPLLVALAVTILDIYELEFHGALNSSESPEINKER